MYKRHLSDQNCHQNQVNSLVKRKMKYSLVFILLIVSSQSLAQTTGEIQNELNQLFDNLYNENLEFVNSLGNALEGRITLYIESFEKLSTQLRNITNNSQLDQQSKDAVQNLLTQIDTLIGNIRKTINKETFTKEVKKFADFVKVNFQQQTQSLMVEFERILAFFPPLAKCWTDSRNLAFNLITDGLKSASSAATFTINNANLTLNANQALVDSTISLYSFLLASCDFDANTRPTCVKSILDLINLTLPGNLNLWASSTADAVKINLQIADTLVRSAVSGAGTFVGQIVVAVQSCVANILSQG
jgi:hypothetical protein